jgi:hypothetical protein
MNSPASAQIGGTPGAFSRMGFSPRGIAMGNAMSSVTSGGTAGYYNPALLPWGEGRHGGAAMGILALDRRLNFLSATLPVPPSAGISIGLINAGVSNIDGRDSDGEPTGALTTSENEVFLGFGIKFPAAFSVGVTLKLFYYHLYTDVSSSTIGIDAGALYAPDPSLRFALVVRDFSSKYRWDTTPLYGQSGTTGEDYFPRLIIAGGSWSLPDRLGEVAAELEVSSVSTTIARAGVEIHVVPEFTLRAGVDRIDIRESGNGLKPAGGFTVRKDLGGWTPELSYTLVAEPFAPSSMHLIGISAEF